MNLAEALIQALPELPTQTYANRKFKFNPDLIIRDELNENGEPVKVVYVPENAAMYYMSQSQFNLYQLFDGERTYAEVSEAHLGLYGVQIDEADVKSFALSSVDSGLWKESAQERNITLSQKLKEERTRRIRKASKFADLSHIIFKGWDPDKFLTGAHRYLSFVYTTWFTLLTLCLFAFMGHLWIDHWTEIGRDTLLYYTFTEKTGRDLAEFWILFFAIGFFHESAHGLTAKHYGAEVHNMGFQLIYLAPAFGVEITELWARVGRKERLWAIIAGLWMEMIFCAVSTVVWWLTAAGSLAHEWAYKVMMVTGIVVLVVNLNPLMKLDGYYALAEIVGISELKENSTAFVSGWVKKNIFRLPVEYDWVPPRRRLLYVPYALLSGVYSYTVLFWVSRFTFNVFKHFYPEWAFVPAGLVAWTIFRSRIKRLFAFMKTVFQHNRDKLVSHLSPEWRMAIAAVVLVVLLAPVLHKTVDAPFVLEPVNKAEIRAKVPGFVSRVLVNENARVSRGDTIAVLRNLDLEGERAKAKSDLEVARSRSSAAQLTYVALGSTQSELQRAERVAVTAQNEIAELTPKVPISGIVTTPHVHDIEGSYVAEGTLLAEVEDQATLRARIYVLDSDLRYVHPGEPVALKLPADWKVTKSTVATFAEMPSTIPKGLIDESRLRGIALPSFYVVDVTVPNPGEWRSGMSGEAKVFVRRQSLLGRVWEGTRDLVVRRIW